MPCHKQYTVDSSKPVLVTGGTGYIAGVLISQLLGKGLTVHTTVRDLSSKDRLAYLKDEAKKYESNRSCLKFFEADLLKTGSFAEAMKGCSIVFHTASPYKNAVRNPDKQLIQPAVQGTENVLLQANQTPSVKRVVMTSSIGALCTDSAESSPENPITEDSWNQTASRKHMPYLCSKKLAEEKAWAIANDQNSWKLVTICPTMVMGPGLKYHSSAESYYQLRSQGCNDPVYFAGAPNVGLNFVDVRDVAASHIAAAFAEDAEGRYLIHAQSMMFPEVGKALAQKHAPMYPIVKRKMPNVFKGVVWLLAPYTGQGMSRKFVTKNWNQIGSLDNSKSIEKLGMEYLPMEQSFQEMYQQIADAGGVKPKWRFRGKQVRQGSDSANTNSDHTATSDASEGQHLLKLLNVSL